VRVARRGIASQLFGSSKNGARSRCSFMPRLPRAPRSGKQPRPSIARIRKRPPSRLIKSTSPEQASRRSPCPAPPQASTAPGAARSPSPNPRRRRAHVPRSQAVHVHGHVHGHGSARAEGAALTTGSIPVGSVSSAAGVPSDGTVAFCELGRVSAAHSAHLTRAASAQESLDLFELLFQALLERACAGLLARDVAEARAQPPFSKAQIARAHDLVAPQQRQRLVAQLALGRRRVGFEAILPAPGAACGAGRGGRRGLRRGDVGPAAPE
jgi:hypothetical protein